MNEIKITVNGKIYRLNNNSNKYDRAKKDAGPNATQEQILAHYDKYLGYIQNEHGDRVENGQFWEVEKRRIADEPNELKNKTREELREIMRGSIDNKNISSSVYHKAKQELEFKNTEEVKKEHVAVKMTESSKNADFIRSDINGQLELDGQGHRFVDTKIGIPRVESRQRSASKNKSFSETTLGKIFIGVVILVVGGILLGYLTNWFGFS